jgi:hypothetical protein
MDIDNRLSNMYLKFRDSDKIMYDYAIVLNKWLSDLNLDVRATTGMELKKLSRPTYDKIMKLMKNDSPWGWQGEYRRESKS